MFNSFTISFAVSSWNLQKPVHCQKHEMGHLFLKGTYCWECFRVFFTPPCRVIVYGQMQRVQCTCSQAPCCSTVLCLRNIRDLLPLLYSPYTLTYIHFFGRGCILFRTIWVCATPNDAYSKHLTDIHISERRTTRSCVCFALSCPLFNSFQILWPVMLLLIPLLLIVHAANCGHFLFWLPMRFAMFLHVSICFLYDNLQCFLKFIDPKISSSAPRVSR